MTFDLWTLALGLAAGLVCGFLNVAASSGSAVSLPILMFLGLDPATANATNRIPILIASLSATASFHAKKAIPWPLALRVAAPVTVGCLAGAGLAEVLSARNMGIAITVAVMAALLLLFTKVKKAIEQATVREPRFGLREIAVFFAIGAWMGFIVLDGATYMLLALTLVVGLGLVPANAIKAFVAVPGTLVAMLVFASHGDIDWAVGAVLGLGSLVGGYLGARLTMAPRAQKYVFALLVLVISGEVVHLTVHYVLGTH
ncbi:MAG: sulfite exporter TauE/SafE family protein [Enhydrobacter sp.]|nr:MAG: sulfite exporter TauE/SafE family protein [Enhydrobacter sp.]